LQSLQLKCDLENIAYLSLGIMNFNVVDYNCRWNVSVKCLNCQEENKNCWVTRSEKQEMGGSKGEVHFAAKCKGCGRVNSILICEEKTSADRGEMRYTKDDSGTVLTMVTFDCRGLEVEKWIVADGFGCKVTGSETTFSGIDLSEEFAEYDEKTDKSVTVTNVETSVEKEKTGSVGKGGAKKKKK